MRPINAIKKKEGKSKTVWNKRGKEGTDVCCRTSEFLGRTLSAPDLFPPLPSTLALLLDHAHEAPLA